jgi:hypothetical protein
MRNARRKLGLLAVLTLVSVTSLACGGGGGGGGSSPTAPQVFYVNVAGHWGGTWLADGIVPVTINLDVFQSQDKVGGSMSMRIPGYSASAWTNLEGIAGPDDGRGGGSFSFTISDPSGSFGGPMTVSGNRMTGYATLRASGTIGGTMSLTRGVFASSADPASGGETAPTLEATLDAVSKLARR